MEAARGLGAPPELRLNRIQRQGEKRSAPRAGRAADAVEVEPGVAVSRIADPALAALLKSTRPAPPPPGRGQREGAPVTLDDLGLDVPDVVLFARGHLDALAAARLGGPPTGGSAPGHPTALDRPCSLLAAQRGPPRVARTAAGAADPRGAARRAPDRGRGGGRQSLRLKAPVTAGARRWGLPGRPWRRRTRCSRPASASSAPRRATRPPTPTELSERIRTLLAPGVRAPGVCTGALPPTDRRPSLDRDWLEIVAAVRPALARLEAHSSPTRGRPGRPRRTALGGAGRASSRWSSTGRASGPRGDRGRAARRLGRNRAELPSTRPTPLRLRRAARPGRAGDPARRATRRAGRARPPTRCPASCSRPACRPTRGWPSPTSWAPGRSRCRPRWCSAAAAPAPTGGPVTWEYYRRVEPMPPYGDVQRGFVGRARRPALDARPPVAGRRARGRGRRVARLVELEVAHTPIEPVAGLDPTVVPAEALLEGSAEDWWTVGRRVRVGRAANGRCCAEQRQRTHSPLCRSRTASPRRTGGRARPLAGWADRRGHPALAGSPPPGLLAARDADVRDRGRRPAARRSVSRPRRRRRRLVHGRRGRAAPGGRSWPRGRSFRSGCTIRALPRRAGGRSRTPRSTSAASRPTDRISPPRC